MTESVVLRKIVVSVAGQPELHELTVSSDRALAEVHDDICRQLSSDGAELTPAEWQLKAGQLTIFGGDDDSDNDSDDDDSDEAGAQQTLESVLQSSSVHPEFTLARR